VPILLVIAAALAAALYLLAWREAGRDAGREEAVAGPGAPPGAQPAVGVAPIRFLDRASLLILGALAAHAVSLYAAISTPTGLRFGFAPALSATLWVGVATLWFEGLSVRIDALRVLIAPAAAVCALLPLVFEGSDVGVGSRPLFLPHLLVGTLAYGVLMLAAMHAMLMTAAERALHGAPVREGSVFARWLDRLPALLVLERILFRFIALGFVFLTLTAVSGVVFTEQVFGRPLRVDHKTVFTLIAWVLFGALLLGRALWGWRGRTALRLTISGFVVLLFAYVGSRFVIEIILQRG
jgi:ABC-type uncharacterized transport system permease subunit